MVPCLARGLFFGLSVPYGLVTWLRNFAFDRGWFRVHRVNIPVISVGNITTGGVGKTPLVEWLARWLLDHGQTPVLVSRGYGGGGAPNDEALLLERNLPRVPHWQNPDRVASARGIVAEQAGSVIVLDDGFQHRRLARDIDLVLIDATDPFGNHHLLPRGFLRENLASLRRADGIIITRVELVEPSVLDSIINQIRQHNVTAPIATVEFTLSDWNCWTDSTETPEINQLSPSLAVCGIGNPEAFFSSLRSNGFNVVGQMVFADHHHFRESDLADIARHARSVSADVIVATLKDAVKIRKDDIEGIPFRWVGITPRFRTGQELIISLIKEKLFEQTGHPNKT